MKKMRKAHNKQRPEHLGNDIIAILKSSIIAIIITLVCFAIFAIIIKVADLQETIIAPVVQVIRTLSIAFGGMLAAKSVKVGWLRWYNRCCLCFICFYDKFAVWWVYSYGLYNIF